MTYSRIIAGTMKWGLWGSRFQTPAYDSIIKQSIEFGITTFDHADIYGDYTTEEEFGRVLQQEPSLRDKMQLITKCGIQKVSPNRPLHQIKSYDTSAQHIIESVETSLENFHTHYIDCLLIHRPDILMNANEIAEAVNQLKEQGKILQFGVSNFTPSQVELINSRIRVDVNQVECSVVHMDPMNDGTLDQCQQHRIIPMAWSPLGGGHLFSGSEEEQTKRILAVTHLLSEKYNAAADTILIAWLLQHPAGIHPVMGTSKADRLKSAVSALDIHLEREEWYMIWRAATGREVA